MPLAFTTQTMTASQQTRKRPAGDMVENNELASNSPVVGCLYPENGGDNGDDNDGNNGGDDDVNNHNSSDVPLDVDVDARAKRRRCTDDDQVVGLLHRVLERLDEVQTELKEIKKDKASSTNLDIQLGGLTRTQHLSIREVAARHLLYGQGAARMKGSIGEDTVVGIYTRLLQPCVSPTPIEVVLATDLISICVHT